MAVCVSFNGSNTAAREKPANRSTSAPAAAIDCTSTSVSMPYETPMMTCVTSAPRKLLVLSNSWGSLMCGAAASASVAASPAFTMVGIMRVLNGGATKSHAAARTSASAKAVIASGSNATFIASRLQEMRNHREEVVGEADPLRQHPVAGDDDHERDARELRDERQRLFLELGRRLQYANEQADCERDTEDRCGKLRRE